MKKKLKSKKSKFGSLFDLKNSAKGRDWNYVMTYADKYLIDTYNHNVVFEYENEDLMLIDIDRRGGELVWA